MTRWILPAIAMLSASTAQAQIPVIDAENYAIAQKTAAATSEILDTNRNILTTVEDTLEAVTGERASAADPLRSLAVGNGFTVASMPSFDRLISEGVPNFGAMRGDIAGRATRFINSLDLVKNLSGQANSSFSGDQSYRQLINTVLGIAALVKGTQEAVETRKAAFERAGSQIGQAADIKGSIDQNTELQVQAGLTINELIGVMNGAVASLQAQNQRRLTDISNTRKALSYDE